MNYTIHTKITNPELVQKIQAMKDSGYNIPQLIRNFLAQFEIAKDKEAA